MDDPRLMDLQRRYPHRKVFKLNGKLFVWESNHPFEERIVELTADYRDADGNFILPEAVAWDGVCSDEE